MAEALKHMYSKELVAQLGKALNNTENSFDEDLFIQKVFDKSWDDLELKARMEKITVEMESLLSFDYEKQIEILRRIAPDFSGFTAILFPNFVELFGLDNEEISIDALHFFTRFSTAEFAIRPFLVQNPVLIKTMLKWSKDENYHVRRLASEGCRPLLPWAGKLTQYVNDPLPIIPILENLKNDPEDYVYRSVANNLNDISKNHPELVLELAEKWYGKEKNTNWLVKHALRTLLKKGNQRAMKLFGFGEIKNVDISNFEIKNPTIKIGDYSSFNVYLINKSKEAKFRLEYSIEYVKKNGKLSEKVFQLRETKVNKNERLSLNKKIDFKNLSTRKHYTGKHYINLILNGNKIKRIPFELI